MCGEQTARALVAAQLLHLRPDGARQEYRMTGGFPTGHGPVHGPRGARPGGQEHFGDAIDHLHRQLGYVGEEDGGPGGDVYAFTRLPAEGAR